MTFKGHFRSSKMVPINRLSIVVCIQLPRFYIALFPRYYTALAYLSSY